MSLAWNWFQSLSSLPSYIRFVHNNYRPQCTPLRRLIVIEDINKGVPIFIYQRKQTPRPRRQVEKAQRANHHGHAQEQASTSQTGVYLLYPLLEIPWTQPMRHSTYTSMTESGSSNAGSLSSYTSCGGINPYTFTARLGPGDLAHYETTCGLIYLLGVSHKETWRGDQERSWSVRIWIDIVLSIANVTD